MNYNKKRTLMVRVVAVVCAVLIFGSVFATVVYAR